jgi:hypothetical protein
LKLAGWPDPDLLATAQRLEIGDDAAGLERWIAVWAPGSARSRYLCEAFELLAPP